MLEPGGLRCETAPKILSRLPLGPQWENSAAKITMDTGPFRLNISAASWWVRETSFPDSQGILWRGFNRLLCTALTQSQGVSVTMNFCSFEFLNHFGCDFLKQTDVWLNVLLPADHTAISHRLSEPLVGPCVSAEKERAAHRTHIFKFHITDKPTVQINPVRRLHVILTHISELTPFKTLNTYFNDGSGGLTDRMFASGRVFTK